MIWDHNYVTEAVKLVIITEILSAGTYLTERLSNGQLIKRLMTSVIKLIRTVHMFIRNITQQHLCT